MVIRYAAIFVVIKALKQSLTPSPFPSFHLLYLHQKARRVCRADNEILFLEREIVSHHSVAPS